MARSGGAEAEEPVLWTLEGGHGPRCTLLENAGGMGRHLSRALTWKKHNWVLLLFTFLPLLSKVYQNQREFWQLEPCVMSSDGLGLGVLHVRGKEQQGK